MKRSQSIRLVLMGTVGAVGALGLSRCDGGGATSRVFADVAQCTPSNDELACRDAYGHALGLHPILALSFAALGDCVARFGATSCEPAGGVPFPAARNFQPRMIGFTMGRDAYGQVGLPVWTDAEGRLYVGGQQATSGGSSIRSSPSIFSRRSGASSSSPSTTSVARGGFGSTGSSAGS